MKFNRPMTIRVTIDTSIFSPFNTYEVAFWLLSIAIVQWNDIYDASIKTAPTKLISSVWFLWNSRLLSLQNNHTDKNQNIFRNFLKPVKDVIVNFSGYVFRQARNQRAACLKTGFDFKTKSSFKNNRSCKVFKVCFGWRIRNKLFKSRWEKDGVKITLQVYLLIQNLFRCKWKCYIYNYYIISLNPLDDQHYALSSQLPP